MEEKFKSVCKFMRVPADELGKPFSNWRFDTLNVYGFENTNTQAVVDYFGGASNKVEWLSNISCNVIFNDCQTAMMALLKAATSVVVNRWDFDDCHIVFGFGLDVTIAEKLDISIPANERYILGKEYLNVKPILIRYATIKDAQPFIETIQKLAKRDHQPPKARPERRRYIKFTGIERKFMSMRADDKEDPNKPKPLWKGIGGLEFGLDIEDAHLALTRAPPRPTSVENVFRIRDSRSQINKAKNNVRPNPSLSTAAQNQAYELCNASIKRPVRRRIDIEFDK